MNKDISLFLGVLIFIGYFLFVLSVFNSLGQLNWEIKKQIYKHYNVALPKDGNNEH